MVYWGRQGPDDLLLAFQRFSMVIVYNMLKGPCSSNYKGFKLRPAQSFSPLM